MIVGAHLREVVTPNCGEGLLVESSIIAVAAYIRRFGFLRAWGVAEGEPSLVERLRRLRVGAKENVVALLPASTMIFRGWRDHSTQLLGKPCYF